MGLRTLHLMAFGALLGGHVFGVEPQRLLPALGLTVATGASLVALELYQSLQWLVLVKGLVVLAKLGLLASVLFFWEARVPLLLAVVALASVGAHMPARFRNYSVLHRRVLGSETPARLAALLALAIAVAPAGPAAAASLYVTNTRSESISVIDTATLPT